MSATGEIGDPCPACHGTGQLAEPMSFSGLATCHVCGGTRKVNPPRKRLARAEQKGHDSVGEQRG